MLCLSQPGPAVGKVPGLGAKQGVCVFIAPPSWDLRSVASPLGVPLIFSEKWGHLRSKGSSRSDPGSEPSPLFGPPQLQVSFKQTGSAVGWLLCRWGGGAGKGAPTQGQARGHWPHLAGRCRGTGLLSGPQETQVLLPTAVRGWKHGWISETIGLGSLVRLGRWGLGGLGHWGGGEAGEVGRLGGWGGWGVWEGWGAGQAGGCALRMGSRQVSSPQAPMAHPEYKKWTPNPSPLPLLNSCPGPTLPPGLGLPTHSQPEGKGFLTDPLLPLKPLGGSLVLYRPSPGTTGPTPPTVGTSSALPQPHHLLSKPSSHPPPPSRARVSP